MEPRDANDWYEPDTTWWQQLDDDLCRRESEGEPTQLNGDDHDDPEISREIFW